MKTTLTQRLVELVTAKATTGHDRERAALFVLDAVANTLAGRNSTPGRTLTAWASQTGVDAARRTFVMGALTHILELDDLHRASVVHPGCVVVPAAWTVAEREGLTGHDFLAATLRGFEATCRVGMAVGPAHYRIWHNTGTCGPFGSAMAVASSLNLSNEAAVHALGNAGTQSAGLWQFLETGAMSKHLHAGRAAEAGVLAADLAAHGFTGPPAILEGGKGFFAGACPDSDPDAVLRDPDAPWQLHATSIKPWPSCRHTHPAIDAAQELRAGFKPGDIEQVTVRVYQAAADVCDNPAPASEYEAKFSLQHCVAAALTNEVIDFDAFDTPARSALGTLARHVAVEVAEPYASSYPQAWGSAVEVIGKGGSKREVSRVHAKGDPEAALSADEMIAKASRLMNFGGVEQPRRLIDSILALTDDGPMPALPL